MVKRLISEEKLLELQTKEENKIKLIEKLRLLGCSEEEIKDLIK